MFAAAVDGYFGDDSKKVAGKVNKYYRAMYNVVPLGLTKGGNAVVLTLPQDYTGQVVGAIFDMALQGQFKGGKGVAGLLAGQQPYNLNPLFGVASDLGAYYLLKANPMNFYYGKHVLTEDEFKAGGKAAAKGMAREAWNELGGSMIYRFRGEHVDEVDHEMKNLLGVFPINAIGRFIRVTNQGEREYLQELVEPVTEKEAQGRLDVKSRVIETVNEKNGKPSVADIKKLYKTLTDEGLLEKGKDFMSFRHLFNRYADRADSVQMINAVMSAGSPKEKAALIQNYEDTLPKEEYTKLRNYLMKEGHISEGVLIQVKKNRKEAGKKPDSSFIPME